MVPQALAPLLKPIDGNLGSVQDNAAAAIARIVSCLCTSHGAYRCTAGCLTTWLQPPTTNNTNQQVMTYGEAVPIGEIVPALIGCVPLNMDHNEDKPVYDCLTGLANGSHASIMPHIPRVTTHVARTATYCCSALWMHTVHPPLPSPLVRVMHHWQKLNSQLLLLRAPQWSRARAAPLI